MIHGVLVEGVDFVGKTIVCEKLARDLSSDGVPVRLNKCYLERWPMIEFFEAQAKQHDSMLERDWYYSAAIVFDIALFAEPREFIVQDRHWLTQVGRNRFFHPAALELIPQGFLEQRHVPFQHNVMLTSNLETKLKRCRSRESVSPRDRYLAANPHLHQEYERFLLDLIPADESWLVLDTSERTVEGIATAIRGFIGC